MTVLRHLSLALAVCAGTLGASAQRVYWEPNHGTLGLGKTSELSLVFEGCAPAGEVNLPLIPNLELGRPSVEQRFSSTFGSTFARVVLTYPVRPVDRSEIVIPAFDAVTDRGKIAVGEVRFDVGDATLGQTELKISDLATGTLSPAHTTLWQGEVVDLEYVLLVSPRYRPQAAPPEWKPSGLIVEPFGDYEDVREQSGGEPRVGARFRTRIAPTTAGTLQLDPVRQTVNLQTGERSGFFAQPRIESFTIESNRPTLDVRPLPPPPAGFTGAVGDFELESKVVPQTARVGEPITWTLKLRGVGNWPANPSLPEREVSADFQVVQPQGRREMDDGRLFSGALTEDAVLVPTRAGDYEIGPVKFVWFDTASGAYREESVPAVTVTIEPPATSPTPATTPTEVTAPVAPEGAAPRSLPDDLRPPTPLPHDPLPPGGNGLAPLGLDWWWWLPVALAAPALAWLGFAWQVMLRGDRLVPRRIARNNLVRGLVQLSRTGSPPDRASLESWRALTAKLWAIERATPTAHDLAIALETERGAARPDDWQVLWQEAEHVIFAAQAELPADWTTRALAAAQAVHLHRKRPPFPLRVRYWRPAVSLLVLGLLTGAFSARSAGAADADAGTRAYQEGNFAAARAAWRVAVTTQPRAWAQRNNLALACAQQEDWAEATAHWTAAFLLNPREPSIRANLRLALTHLDGVDPELRRLVEGSWLDRGVTLLAPGEWEAAYFGGAIALAVGFILLLSTLYLPQNRRWRTRTGLVLVVIGVLASVVGFTGRFLYGPLAHPEAGLVVRATELRSIPSDLAEDQQTAPISAGAVVVPRRGFLGWQRVDALRLSAGWLRSDAIVPFYRSPPVRKASAQPL